MDQTHKSKARSGTGSQNWLLRGLVIAFLIATVITAYLTFVAVREFVTNWGVAGIPDINLNSQTSDSGLPENLGEKAKVPLQSVSGPTPEPWDGTGRVNVLLMGLDYRDWNSEDWAPRTDTMILLSVDSATKTAGMLSIPRDLWVNIPSFESAKINTAYRLGEIYNIPGGGPGLAMKTVEDLLGMNISFYAQIDFNAFERFIDEINGIKLDVPYEMEVDPMGDNNNKVLQPGVQVLNGSLALAYARARNTAGSDFDRARRQQQVILGIRNRLLSPESLLPLLRKAPLLYSELSSGVRTNLSLEQIVKLAWLAQQIPDENIKEGVLEPPDEVTLSTSFDGQDILIPNPEQIRLLRDELFTTTGPAVPAVVDTDPKALMNSESARVSVLNGTVIPGLASRTADYLTGQGINVVEPGNAEELYNLTTIIDYTGNPGTVEYLVELMGISDNRIFQRYDPYSQVDVVVLLGDDWVDNNPMP